MCLRGEKSAYQKFYNDNPQFEKHLKTFGEIGIVTTKPGPKIKNKLEDRGAKCMFVGYAANHAGNVYRMLDLKTKRVLISRDVTWMNSFERKSENKIDNDDSDDEVPNETTTEELDNNEIEVQENNDGKPKTRLTRELKGLKTFNNPGRIELEGENVNFCFLSQKM